MLTETATQPMLKKNTYTYNEVLKATLAYFNGDELAATTWMNKYAVKDKKGNLVELTPDDMHHRMAKEYARIEKKYSEVHLNASFKYLSAYGQKRTTLTTKRIYDYFKNFRYIIPQGSVMAVLGNPYIFGSLSNCIVLPEIFDSYGGILHTDQQLVQLFKRRCGVGIDISTIRPSGAAVSNAAGTTSGAVSFMERFSNTTREVGQKGRRGALMITMDIAHPDIEQFITVKQDLSKVTGANISVRVSDEFMQAVEKDKNFALRFPVDAKKPTIVKNIRARDLWNTIVNCAHNTAEPGIIFWDRQHVYSTSSVYPEFKNTSTNPCSEIAMQGGDSCRLMALNLFSFVENPFTENASFNFKKFYETTYEAQRLMDDLVDLELESIERILKKIKSDPEPDSIKQVETETWKLLYETGKKGRRTGLGFTAFADALAALNIKFDSQEAMLMTEQMIKTKCEAEFESSVDMAIERGKFKGFDARIENTSGFVQMLKKELPQMYERMMKFGRRNISISTVAPTGTLSMMSQTSSGIEPVFMLHYKRRKKVNPSDKNATVDFVDDMGDTWQEFDVYHHGLKKWMDVSGKTAIAESPFHGATAPEIDWRKRVALQAIVQKYTTHSISSTINLPQNINTETVGNIYLEAWHSGLKGITVYRDGSRSGVLIAAEKKDDAMVLDSVPPKRPKVLEADIVRFMNNKEKWIAVIGLINNRPYEIFTGKAEESFIIPEWVKKGWVIKNKNGNGNARYDFQYMDSEGYKTTIEGLSRSFNPEYWNYAKLISGVLRHGMPMVHVTDLIENLSLDSAHINTWKNGVQRALKKYIPADAEAKDKTCPSCGDADGLYFEEGCLKCKSCGHSKCS